MRSPFHDGSLKTIDDVEYTTMGWVDWHNNRRLHSCLGYLTPDKFETLHYGHIPVLQPEITQP